MSNAYDNPRKQESRKLISDSINRHSENVCDVSMVELLGEGIGAQYYLQNVKNLSHIFLVERSKYNSEVFRMGRLGRFKKQYPDTSISLQRASINTFLDASKKETLNVINLDLCGLFKVDANHYINNVLPVYKVFKNKNLTNNGLLFVTYKIGGWLPMGWNVDSVLNKPIDIENYIGCLAFNEKIKLSKIHEFQYSSIEGHRCKNQGSVMLNLGFKVNYEKYK